MSDDPAFVADPPSLPASVSPPRVSSRDSLPVFRQTQKSNGDSTNLELAVSIELGRVRMRLSDVLSMSEGSVLELDKLAHEPVDVVVNDQLVARGEVVVLNEKFAVRITEVMPAAKEAHA
jgi:flagellar motor switch protein FliN/FliY